jgi:hypothetical protein
MGVIWRQSQSSLLFYGIVVFPYRTRYAFLVRLPKPGIPAVVSAVPILISQLGLREGCLFQVQFFLFDGL